MFGMGTGGSLRLLSPEIRGSFPHPQNRTGSGSVRRLTMTTSFALRNFSLCFSSPQTTWLPFGFLDQALDLLVSSSSIRYRTFTDDLSTLSSSRGLTSFRCGNSLLQGGFTLRCLQRLSRPHFASQLCRWHDNCCTRGASIPVLSY